MKRNLEGLKENINAKADTLNRAKFNEFILQQTYKYQKIYNFEMSKGAEATHNNEADAFKHAYMQAYLSIVNGRNFSKSVGDWHEFIDGAKDPRCERNMDLWNNSIGREVAEELKNNLDEQWEKLTLEEKLDFAAEDIVQRMRNGELITSPDDKRNYKNMMIDRLQEKDRIFYDGEYYDMDRDNQLRYSKYHTDYVNKTKGKLPSEISLKAKVALGDLIYVKNYQRGDGTRVSGYYRRKVIY